MLTVRNKQINKQTKKEKKRKKQTKQPTKQPTDQPNKQPNKRTRFCGDLPVKKTSLAAHPERNCRNLVPNLAQHESEWNQKGIKSRKTLHFTAKQLHAL